MRGNPFFFSQNTIFSTYASISINGHDRETNISDVKVGGLVSGIFNRFCVYQLEHEDGIFYAQDRYCLLIEKFVSQNLLTVRICTKYVMLI